MEAHPEQQHIGKYRLLEEIGQGSVSTVYKGYDAAQDRLVAIKVLAPPFAADPDLVQLFLRQARTTAQLQHPHLVAVLDAGQQNGWTWMGMEYLDGIPLRELVRLQGPMLLHEAQSIVRDLAGALDYIHGSGLLHGDVRSGNVIICPPGRAILTELGVVRTRWEGQVASSAVSSAVAPEQVTGSELGPWTDLYALGILAYEMLGGRPPYASDTTAGLLSQVVHEPIPSIRALRPDLAPAVAQALERALAKDPRSRYSSGADLAAALGEAAGQPLPEASPAAPAAAAEKSAPPLAPTPYPSIRLPDQPPPPPWETVPIRAAPPPQPRPAASAAAPKITPLPSTPAPPSTPADRIARRRAAAARSAPPKGKKAGPAGPRAPTWLWLLLGAEALILLAGIVLIVLLVTGIL